MAGRRVVVIGDVMIDEWIWGKVTRISPEAPVPVVSVNDHSFTLGGAGNVANNLRALGAAVAFVGAVGEDAEGERVRALLAEIAVDTRGSFRSTDRPTTRKTRIVAHNQQVVRADWESTAPLGATDRAAAVARVAERGRRRRRGRAQRLRQRLPFARDRRSGAGVSAGDRRSQAGERRACSRASIASRPMFPRPRVRPASPSSTARRSNCAARTLLNRLGCRDVHHHARRSGHVALRPRRRTRRHSVGRALGVRRQRRRRHGRRGVDAGACRAHADRDGDAAGELRRRRGGREARHGDGLAGKRSSRCWNTMSAAGPEAFAGAIIDSGGAVAWRGAQAAAGQRGRLHQRLLRFAARRSRALLGVGARARRRARRRPQQR